MNPVHYFLAGTFTIRHTKHTR